MVFGWRGGVQKNQCSLQAQTKTTYWWKSSSIKHLPPPPTPTHTLQILFRTGGSTTDKTINDVLCASWGSCSFYLWHWAVFGLYQYARRPTWWNTPVMWPPRSPDFTPKHLQGHMNKHGDIWSLIKLRQQEDICLGLFSVPRIFGVTDMLRIHKDSIFKNFFNIFFDIKMLSCQNLLNLTCKWVVKITRHLSHLISSRLYCSPTEWLTIICLHEL